MTGPTRSDVGGGASVAGAEGVWAGADGPEAVGEGGVLGVRLLLGDADALAEAEALADAD
jgi:hypothetical protein